MSYRAEFRQDFSAALFAKNFEFFYHNGQRFAYPVPPGIKTLEVMMEASIKHDFARFVCSTPGFPDTPFLQFLEQDMSTMQRALLKYLSQFRPDRSPLVQSNHGLQIIRTPSGIRNGYEDMLWDIRRSEPAKPLIKEVAGAATEMTITFINWSLHNQRLIELFKAWLKENRPPGIEMAEGRGSGSLREKLKFLSAQRLMEVMTPSAASDLTAKFSKDHKSYYAEAPDWNKKEKVSSIMEDLFTPFFLFDQGRPQFNLPFSQEPDEDPS